jgi:uncharacterized protein (DUF169 family)
VKNRGNEPCQVWWISKAVERSRAGRGQGMFVANNRFCAGDSFHVMSTNDFEKALHKRMATDMDTGAVGLKI